jgi:hypothetical protein
MAFLSWAVVASAFSACKVAALAHCKEIVPKIGKKYSQKGNWEYINRIFFAVQPPARLLSQRIFKKKIPRILCLGQNSLDMAKNLRNQKISCMWPFTVRSWGRKRAELLQYSPPPPSLYPTLPYRAFV